MTDVHQQQRQQQQYTQNMNQYNPSQATLATRVPNQSDNIVHAMVHIAYFFSSDGNCGKYHSNQ